MGRGFGTFVYNSPNLHGGSVGRPRGVRVVEGSRKQADVFLLDSPVAACRVRGEVHAGNDTSPSCSGDKAILRAAR